MARACPAAAVYLPKASTCRTLGVMGWKAVESAIIRADIPRPPAWPVAGKPPKKLGLSLAAEPKTSPAELKPSPQVLLLNWCRKTGSPPPASMEKTPMPKLLDPER